MSGSHISALNAQVDGFPPLPATVNRVIDVTSNPESSADDLMCAILPDQVMCSAILKMANSAFFGIPKGVSTIQRAIVVLGQQEVRNIVIGKAIFSSFPGLIATIRETVGLFWDHSFTCGLAAKIIAETQQLNPSEFFIAGLIHDIGKLAMLMTFPNEYPLLRELSNPSHFQDTTEETNGFGITHAEVGMRLAHRWMLPDQLCTAIGYHHRPEDATAHRRFPLIVQMADILSLIYCCLDISNGDDVEQIFKDFFPETVGPGVGNMLQWKPGDIGRWFETLKDQRDRDREILEILASS